MIINWYPGHMAKAKRLIQENLKIIDVVIELVDARIPMSSTNPMIKSLIGDKPSVVVLNKADLADPAVLDEWVAYYKQQGRKVLALNSKGGKGVKQLISWSAPWQRRSWPAGRPGASRTAPSAP